MSPFDTDAGSVWSVPAGTGFLDQLAEGLLAREDVADCLVFLPNVRATQALADALVTRRGGLVLPDIRPLAHLDEDETLLALSGAGLDMAPEPDPADRLGLLMRLARAHADASGHPVSPASLLFTAQELAGLLDQAAIGGDVDWSALPDLITDSQLAGHWERSVDFLKIVTEAWPDILRERGYSAAGARQSAAIDALLSGWDTTPPRAPVILAGSTGSNAATRRLMAGIARLKYGRVLLPGLDTTLSASAAEALAETPKHPQSALCETVLTLNHAPDDVPTWPAEVPRPERTQLIAEALAPAQDTADWVDRLKTLAPDADTRGFCQRALSGLELIEAEDPADEARIAALLLRETLETPSARAALVTPDAGLSRRVAEMLRRWGLDIRPTAGLPVLRTESGALLRCAADWLCDAGDPVALLSVLKHPLVRLLPEPEAQAEALSALEVSRLRGARTWASFDDLKARTSDPKAAALLEALSEHMAEPHERSDLRTRLVALSALLTALTAGKIWARTHGAALADMLEELARIGDQAGDMTARDTARLIYAFAASRRVAEADAPPSRLSIWGPLEARLQSVDRVVLAGLNEGVWPAPPGGDTFLPRHLRAAIGLPDPEARIGLSAHDFAQLAALPEVYLLRAKRVDDQPSVASRWLWRLQTLAAGALGPEAAQDTLHKRQAELRDWARQLDRPVHGVPMPDALCPRPAPPVSARPIRFGVTEIERLIRDPYAIYAKRVLGLERLDPVGNPSTAAERGIAIHAALEAIEREGLSDAEAEAKLSELIDARLREVGLPEAERRAARPWLEQTARAYLNWRRTRTGRVLPEERGELSAKIDGVEHTLVGKADRLEIDANRAAIVDYKTGQPPSQKQVGSLLAPQLPLLGAMAKAGAFATLGPLNVSELAYVKFGARFEARKALSGKHELDAVIAEALAKWESLMVQYRAPDRAYPSAPIPEFKDNFGEYDRLARRAEWADLTGEGEA